MTGQTGGNGEDGDDGDDWRELDRLEGTLNSGGEPNSDSPPIVIM